MRDGDGWTECSLGHRHWGRFGAAGLMVVTVATRHVLLQHRASWSHGGDTWGVPGGARDRDETAQQAAHRETVEETALDVSQVVTIAEHVADHGTWTYTTLVGMVADQLPVVAERESLELRWVPLDDVSSLPLLPAFAAALPSLLALLPEGR